MRTKVKRVYESPLMECTQIEAEGTFAGSIVDDKGKGTKISAESQDYVDFSHSSTWEENGVQGKDDVIKWD